MDTTSIQLDGLEIDSITLADGVLRLGFSRAHLIKTMTGSVERTRWWQAGALVLEGAEVRDGLPAAPLVCSGGDVVENVYTYRDMVPIPLESRGHCRCDLKIQGSDQRLQAEGTAVRLEMVDVPKYIEHIRPDA